MEWIILGVIVLLTAINVPIGYALSVATILAILWTGGELVGLNASGRDRVSRATILPTPAKTHIPLAPPRE